MNFCKSLINFTLFLCHSLSCWNLPNLLCPGIAGSITALCALLHFLILKSSHLGFLSADSPLLQSGWNFLSCWIYLPARICSLVFYSLAAYSWTVSHLFSWFCGTFMEVLRCDFRSTFFYNFSYECLWRTRIIVFMKPIFSCNVSVYFPVMFLFFDFHHRNSHICGPVRQLLTSAAVSDLILNIWGVLIIGTINYVLLLSTCLF